MNYMHAFRVMAGCCKNCMVRRPNKYNLANIRFLGPSKSYIASKLVIKSLSKIHGQASTIFKVPTKFDFILIMNPG